jgi:hypothetical protein
VSSPRNNIGWRALVKKVADLLHSWWVGDRVRIAPTEGRLLRLQPPCLLLIGDQPARVCRRRVHGLRVIYFCRTIVGQDSNPAAGNMAKLESCPTMVGIGRLIIDRSGVKWRLRRQVQRLHESDIEVFPVT